MSNKLILVVEGNPDHLELTPVNFDWLQGFISAMVASKLKNYQQSERTKSRVLHQTTARSDALRERAASRLAQKSA